MPPLFASTLRGLDRLKISSLTDVQVLCLETFNHEQDVLVQSRAGTGKSTSIGILLNEQGPGSRLTLIVCPNPVLCKQTLDSLSVLIPSQLSDIRMVVSNTLSQPSLLGGILPMKHTLVIGDPDSLTQCNDRLGRFCFNTLIFDEADALFDECYLEKSVNLIRACLRPETKTIFMSATFPPFIKTRIEECLHEADPSRPETPFHLELCSSRTVDSSRNAVVPHVKKLFVISHPDAVIQLINELNPRSDRRLVLFGGSQKFLSSLASILPSFKICTFKTYIDDYSKADIILDPKGLLSRGLNIPNLVYGISKGVPESKELLLHQWGRIAREGQTDGQFFHIVTADEIEHLNFLSFQLGVEFEEFCLTQKLHPFETHTSTEQRLEQVLALVQRAGIQIG